MSGTVSPDLPVASTARSVAEPKIRGSLITLRDALNAVLSSSNTLDGAQIEAGTVPNTALASLAWSKMLGTSVQAQLGVNDGTTVSRGKAIIPGAESRTNVAYGTLTTPDQVANIVLPTNGLIFVAYQARWQNSVSTAGNANIFIGANALKGATQTGVPLTAEVTGPTGTGADTPLASSPVGLRSASTSGQAADVTTGQFVGNYSAVTDGGPTTIFAAAGTYTISVQFKSSSGSVTVTDRKLWVWTLGF